MIGDINVIVPDELLENMQIFSSVISPKIENRGILILTENIDPANTHDKAKLAIVKFYLLKKSGTEYFVENELMTFKFERLESAVTFLERLPTMSALEMLLLKKSRGVKVY